MRLINEIVVHCTATNAKWYASRSAEDVVAEIRRWHTEERGWSDIGYHAIVHRDGSVAHGRSDDRKGAHVAGRNSTTIGVSLVGGRGGVANGKFEDNFTPEQDAALRKLIADYKEKHPKIDTVSGHNDYASKACPGFNVGEWLNG
jgi:N-acetyl-anhydromuramyl-L-alanine amidase AmpD